MLNDMRSDHVEVLQPVFRAKTKAALLGLLAVERVPFYTDGQWSKVFRQGGPLEWYNLPLGYDPLSDTPDSSRWLINLGTREEFVEEAAEKARAHALVTYQFMLQTVPTFAVDGPPDQSSPASPEGGT